MKHSKIPWGFSKLY